MNIDLTGTTALVTGASRGIGLAIATGLTKSGAKVCAHYHRNEAAAQALVDEAANGSLALAADLSDVDAAADLFDEAVGRLGVVDVLINNAGIAVESPIEEDDDRWVSAWRRTLDVNLVSAAVLSRRAIAHFRGRGGGRIVHIASRAAFRGDTPEYLAYGASKAGMVALSRSIARGFGKDGVKSFVIAPGFTRTDMAQEFIDRYGESVATADIALDRLTEPGDIAPLVVFLASGMADHATGTTIDVNAASYVR